MHLRGVVGEAETECRALKTLAWTARALGASRAEGRALARYAWLRIYPRLPTDYRSSECRDGGALDLRPASRVWP